MRIALDARSIYRPNRRGTGKNLVDLYRHLAAACPHWQVMAFCRQGGPLEAILPEQVEPRPIAMIGGRFDAWGRLRLPLAAWRDNAEVLHCPANDCPTWLPLPTVVTIHDLIPLDLPAGRPPAQLHRFEQSVRTATRRAAWIITPSNYTRDRLVADFEADSSRISVIPWAADSSLTECIALDRWTLQQKYGVNGPYVLHFGADPVLEPHKNTKRLIEAWAMIKASHRRNWTLLVVGLEGAAAEQLKMVITRLGADDTIRLHGFADEADLPGLLRGAEILAYPSLSEGFGLPILDGWATATAVLSSPVSSIPEIAQGAGHMVNPEDACALASGLRKLMDDHFYRKELIVKGRCRLAGYSWQKTVDRFVRTMRQVRELGVSRSNAA